MSESTISFHAAISTADATTALEVPLYDTDGNTITVGTNSRIKIEYMWMIAGASNILPVVYYDTTGSNVEVWRTLLAFSAATAIHSGYTLTPPNPIDIKKGDKFWVRAAVAGTVQIHIRGTIRQ